MMRISDQMRAGGIVAAVTASLWTLATFVMYEIPALLGNLALDAAVRALPLVLVIRIVEGWLVGCLFAIGLRIWGGVSGGRSLRWYHASALCGGASILLFAALRVLSHFTGAAAAFQPASVTLSSIVVPVATFAAIGVATGTLVSATARVGRLVPQKPSRTLPH